MLKTLLQVVGVSLFLQLLLGGLECSAPVRLDSYDDILRYCAYGAAVVSSRICLFFRSCTSGLCCKCFSSEFRRSTGEMGVSSTLRSGVSSIAAILMVTSVSWLWCVEKEVGEDILC